MRSEIAARALGASCLHIWAVPWLVTLDQLADALEKGVDLSEYLSAKLVGADHAAVMELARCSDVLWEFIAANCCGLDSNTIMELFSDHEARGPWHSVIHRVKAPPPPGVIIRVLTHRSGEWARVLNLLGRVPEVELTPEFVDFVTWEIDGGWRGSVDDLALFYRSTRR